MAVRQQAALLATAASAVIQRRLGSRNCLSPAGGAAAQVLQLRPGVDLAPLGRQWAVKSAVQQRAARGGGEQGESRAGRLLPPPTPECCGRPSEPGPPSQHCRCPAHWLLCRSSVASVLMRPSPGGSVPTARTRHERHCQDLNGRGLGLGQGQAWWAAAGGAREEPCCPLAALPSAHSMQGRTHSVRIVPSSAHVTPLQLHTCRQQAARRVACGAERCQTAGGCASSPTRRGAARQST